MNKHTLALLALAAVAAPAAAATANTLSFQQGVNGYHGVQDAELRSSNPSSPQADMTSISVDGDDGSPGLKPNHGLIAFSDLGLAATDTIVSATLTLTVDNPGSGFTVHDMLVSWDESTATWNNLVGGVQGDGVEASIAFASFGANNGSENVGTGLLTIDVTASLQAMIDGTLPGYGWALVPFTNGTNGIDFYTSEYALIDSRPLLTVEVMPVPEPETYAMLLAGLGMIGAVAQRRTQR